MNKLIAILNVIAWSGFWAFGYLALSANVEDTAQIVTATLLAALGAGFGVFSYLWLVRHTEATGYARASNRRSRPLEDDTE